MISVTANETKQFQFVLDRMEIVYNAYAAFIPSFGGLDKGGLITIIVVSVILIIAVVWLHRGTQRRD